MTTTQNEILEKYITAYITLGPQLTEDCFYNSKTIDNLIFTLENFNVETERIKRYRELEALIHNLDKSRGLKKALPFIICYASTKEAIISLTKLYNGPDALLKDVHLDFPLDESQYYLIKRFLRWCNLDLCKKAIEIQNRLSYFPIRQLKIMELRSLGYSLTQVAEHFHTTEEFVSEQEHIARFRFQISCRSISEIIKLEMAMSNSGYLLPLEIMKNHLGAYGDASSALFTDFDRHDIKYLTKKEVFVLDHHQISENELLWANT